jgi:hypothetical protein
MRVIVEILPTAREDLITLLEPRSPVKADAVAFAYTYLADIEDQFQKFDGLPPGARRTPGPDGNDWWWRYVNGVWVVYRISNSRRWRFGAVVRTVTVVAFEAAFPTA